MRYAGIDECEIVNGNGVGVSLYIQGCPIRCKGCFNPETWDFNDGQELNFDTEWKLFECLNSEQINRFSILGGEPLVETNIFELMLLIFDIKQRYLNKEIWLWTGYTWEQLEERLQAIKAIWPETNLDSGLHPLLRQIDYIITGPFIEEEKDLTLKWRGSRNQEIIKCKESIAAERKILYED